MATTDTRLGLAETMLLSVDTKLGTLDSKMERADGLLAELV